MRQLGLNHQRVGNTDHPKKQREPAQKAGQQRLPGFRTGKRVPDFAGQAVSLGSYGQCPHQKIRQKVETMYL